MIEQFNVGDLVVPYDESLMLSELNMFNFNIHKDGARKDAILEYYNTNKALLVTGIDTHIGRLYVNHSHYYFFPEEVCIIGHSIPNYINNKQFNISKEV